MLGAKLIWGNEIKNKSGNISTIFLNEFPKVTGINNWTRFNHKWRRWILFIDVLSKRFNKRNRGTDFWFSLKWQLFVHQREAVGLIR